MSVEKGGFVYILSNWRNTVLYVGVTNDLMRRVWEHKFMPSKGFAWKYFVRKLVYYEEWPEILPAIDREKQIKNYSRKKKDSLITAFNPTWVDLSPDGRSLLRVASRPS